MKIEVPNADVVDRITILELKLARLTGPSYAHSAREHEGLCAAWAQQSTLPLSQVPQLDALRAVNRSLWDVEDALRRCEQRSDFGDEFVRLARSVYVLNDERARLKREINLATDSVLMEQKSYAPMI